MAITRRIFELIDTPLGVKDGDQNFEQKVEGSLSFEKVTFSYDTGPVILDQIDFQLEKGKTLAIVGPTGSGKSTLLKLLLRYYDPSEGGIRLDGKNIKDLKQSDLRSSISYVHQDTYLFHGSVEENILYGTPEASKEELQRAFVSWQKPISLSRNSLKATKPLLVNGVKNSQGDRDRELPSQEHF